MSIADVVLTPPGAVTPRWPAGEAVVFHSGPGGMLSHWILRRLLQERDLKVIYLGAGSDAASSRRILAEDWSALGFGRLDLIERVEILPGALDQPQLGLSAGDWEDLARRADVLVHAGARINMTEPYRKLRAANVLGVREMLRLCVHRKPKPMHAVGSFAIIDHSMADQEGLRVNEDTDLTSFQGLENGYRKSRWAADAVMRRAIGRGLPVTIHRMTPISGDSVEGIIDPGEIAWRVVRGMVASGAAPRSSRPLDLLPVDRVVEAMLTLARDPEAAPVVHHITGGEPLSWETVADVLRSLGYRIETVQPPLWIERLKARAAADPSDDSLGGLLPLANADGRDHRHLFTVDGVRTKARLAALGMDLKSTDREVLRKTVEYLIRGGFVPKPVYA
ncbi:SDR family oxidoreductase [Methylopila musalis]|uniref:SDR family oxidoreductase n=1 Tax=Methylopila musalis TaxID=1134781 RepID=A0ABW3Z427_9HYPH